MQSKTYLIHLQNSWKTIVQLYNVQSETDLCGCNSVISAQQNNTSINYPYGTQ